MEILKASIKDLHSITKLFDLYREFYQQESDIDGANEFIRERLTNEESVIFLALDKNEPIGFTQLYPAFSSVKMNKTWILNDLYVIENARSKGVGEAILRKAITFAGETGAKGLMLETGEDNVKAQRLYERIGFIKETNYFYHYPLEKN